jgi:hypothetical protein
VSSLFLWQKKKKNDRAPFVEHKERRDAKNHTRLSRPLSRAGEKRRRTSDCTKKARIVVSSYRYSYYNRLACVVCKLVSTIGQSDAKNHTRLSPPPRARKEEGLLTAPKRQEERDNFLNGDDKNV